MKEEKIQEHLEEIAQLFPVYTEGYPTMAFADLFGMGCYLISSGKVIPGRKAVDASLTALKVSQTRNLRIIKFVLEFPREALGACNAHNEVQGLAGS